ncbi:MAG TPA: SusC/RagA family TonB-linked outer membrane protein [Gemmatimonadales bacterium]|nr:SusC/RagA family TonB-linked outer membrane protein [Gemmatimonadales bacterium]
MEKKIIRAFVALATGLVFAVTVTGTALAQETQVSGTVTAATGERLPGVTVQVRGATTTTTTDANGKYTISAPSDGVLLFALIGYKGAARTIAGRPQIDVALESAVAVLEPVIVTGYTAQRRADITGSVSSVNVESAQEQTSTSVLQRLDGRVAGVTVETGGAPGSRSTVRIRGVTGFQNNDPLYIIDGMAVSESYLNFLNPDDIASMQVLKDASAASIYGSRASNGVIIIETKKGRPGQRQVTLDVRTGVATPTHGYDDILITNSLDYFQVVKAAYDNAGQGVPRNIYGDPSNPSVPGYIWPNDGVGQSCSAPSSTCTTVVDPSTYAFPTTLIMPGSPGTNWWKAVFGTGQYRDANLALSGGGDDNAYHLSLNYLDQEGTAAYTRFQRGGARINTTFNIGRASIGENVSFSREQHHGAEGLIDDNVGEGGIVGKNIFQQPVVPVYDIAGNFASGKATGLSNLTNPRKIAFFAQHNIATNDRVFGNVFGTVDAGHALSLKTNFGFNLNQGSYHGYTPATPEDHEPTDIDGINENYSLFSSWSWSNTLNYSRTMNQHNLTLLLGQEANKGVFRFEAGNCAKLLNNGVDSRYIQDALCDPTTKNVTSSGSKRALLSFFGKADYNYGERYYLSLTVRRDGSSAFGVNNRWGTFPAVGAGWRLSRESFFQSLPVQNVMLRFGWGVTGNQNVPFRIYDQYGGDRGDVFYDIGGTGSSIQPGFKVTALGNPNLKWEENHSTNVGLDLEFLSGRGNFTADLYRRNTTNLLFDPPQPATGGSAAPPILNIGSMRNTGVDFSIGYHSTIGSTLWSVTFNGSHYKNKITKIDGVQSYFLGRGSSVVREQNAVRNELGHPLGAFYGLVADGYYVDSLDADPYWSSGARPGRMKFKDLNGDGLITNDDRTIIGSPHPDFTAGLDLAVRRGSWEVSATVFGTFGNDIFNTQKYWYVYRYFATNVAKDLLANSVELDKPCDGVNGCSGNPRVLNPGAKYPRIDNSDAFSRQWSSYWIEDGSYVRLRTLQIAYNLPPALVRWIPAARVYLQAENLFTISGYSGLDPSLPVPAAGGATGDIRDESRGIDQGVYPSNKIITIGISTTF